MTLHSDRPGARYHLAIQPLWDAINIYEGPTAYLATIERCRPELANLFAAHFCQSEVCNGGFRQFFSNSTGVLAPEAIAGFRAIAQPNVAAVVERAMAVFAPSYPRDREVRSVHPAVLGKDAFSKLDSEFYGFLNTEAGGFAAAADAYATVLDA
jgi:hypothetical protein